MERINISIPFPWPVYGYVYDSNGTRLAGAKVTLSSGSSITVISNSGGKYVGNLMSIGYSGGKISVYAVGDGERYSDSFTITLKDVGKNLNITLKEAGLPNNISLNTCKAYGNELYMFTPWSKESYLKTIDE